MAEAAPPTQASTKWPKWPASFWLACSTCSCNNNNCRGRGRGSSISNELSFGQPFVAVKLAALHRHSQRGCVKSSGQTQRRRTWNEATWKGSRNALTVCLGIGIACSLSLLLPLPLCPLTPLSVSCCLSVCPTVRLRLTVSVKEPASVILMAARLLPFFPSSFFTSSSSFFLFYLLLTNKIILILDFLISFCCC